MKLNIFISFALIISLISSCKTPKEDKFSHFKATNEFIVTSGRTDTTATNDIVLIGSASSISFKVQGDSCTVLLKNKEASHGYIALEIDNEYIERLKIEGTSYIHYNLPLKKEKEYHNITLYKATEAQTGDILFGGINAKKIAKIPSDNRKKIEFIGNSITCGMGVDYEKIPCGSGEWFDQHNAYFAYGPRVARALNVDFMLSSSSGIGVYRNWDVDGPTMPEVYENRYLNTDSTKKWNFKRFNPDVVSICLGTNDLSDGDDIHPRLPFDAQSFTEKYISFVNKIYSHYPSVQVVLLSSPMMEGEKSEILNKCLKDVKKYFDENSESKKEIAIYSFEAAFPHGCTSHPDIKDHKVMAEKLIPFYKKFLE
ncbi:SGNH/GDSL hydrolase family protein [Abyssalbus ytuae]|uniref:GDSL-type esterase/lipase family protein n=1 Tax=Abyssalbus ytuae TaxID=2926907 RepID=A0A9E6ZUP0_9FLAO|nr:SGNH/GDSL hydrolase family protein [Abyssalbus ytuae]UOB18133.1 GDSL-type esterase/lipase family protein [Abyssalbus ytuae]